MEIVTHGSVYSAGLGLTTPSLPTAMKKTQGLRWEGRDHYMASWQSSVSSDLNFLGAQPFGQLLTKELAPFEFGPPFKFWHGTLLSFPGLSCLGGILNSSLGPMSSPLALRGSRVQGMVMILGYLKRRKSWLPQCSGLGSLPWLLSLK